LLAFLQVLEEPFLLRGEEVGVFLLFLVGIVLGADVRGLVLEAADEFADDDRPTAPVLDAERLADHEAGGIFVVGGAGELAEGAVAEVAEVEVAFAAVDLQRRSGLMSPNGTSAQPRSSSATVRRMVPSSAA
jgi:hypothetical protein